MGSADFLREVLRINFGSMKVVGFLGFSDAERMVDK
jgi:hypothetical protein